MGLGSVQRGLVPAAAVAFDTAPVAPAKAEPAGLVMRAVALVTAAVAFAAPPLMAEPAPLMADPVPDAAAAVALAIAP